MFGQEINAETYAIAKADLLLKGEGDAADNLVGGPEHSTLANDAFPSREFDFMLSNPLYGKNWKGDLVRMGGKDGIKDPRFVVEHAGDPEYSLVTRSSDGQMLFLANMFSKMKRDTKLGSRIAEGHNGSSLFTGDAGQGESNIRRWIIETTGSKRSSRSRSICSTTPASRRTSGCSATANPRTAKARCSSSTPRSGTSRCARISARKIASCPRTTSSASATPFSPSRKPARIFENAAFGYWKVTVERPLRLKGIDPDRVYTAKEIKALKESAERADDAPPVITRTHKKGTAADPLHGLFATTLNGKPAVVEYEPDSDLRDTEQVPLLEDGSIEAFLRREVLPHASDAWYDPASVRTGYEISFTRYFYKPQPLRTLEEIRADVLALEKETEGLLEEIIGSSR